MTRREKIIQALRGGAVLTLFASSASAALSNSGFESPDARGGDVWTSPGFVDTT